MKTLFRTLVFTLRLTLLLLPAAASAQTTIREAFDTSVVTLTEFRLSDGSRVYGSILRETEDELVIRTHAGAELTVAREKVVSMKPMAGRVENGEFFRDDPHVTRLFFAPTGRSLAPGKVSLGLFGYVMPFVQVGVTERLSVGGGTPLMFGLGEGNRPFWVTPKFQLVDGPNLQVAAGTLHMFSGHGDQMGIAYTVGTVGHADKSVSAGVGYAYSDDDSGGPVGMIGAERRLRHNLKFISENYVWRGGGILSGGVRFIGDRFSTDLALVAPVGSDAFFVFPVVNLVYVF